MVKPGERCKTCAHWDALVGNEEPLEGCVSYDASLELHGESAECLHYEARN